MSEAMNNNPYSLLVNAENARCVIEFDVDSEGDINYETWELFLIDSWTVINDAIHDKTWESIEDQIKAQWADVEEQQRAYDENY